MLEGPELQAELRKYDRILAQRPHDAIALSLRALHLGLANRWGEALRDVELAVGLVAHGDPAELDVLALRAMVRRELGQLEGALSDLNQLAILKLRPPVLAARGEIHRRLGELGAARADLDRSLGLSVTDPFTYVVRGRISMMEGRPEAALPDYDAAQRLDPDDISVFHHRARARRALGDHAGARADWDAALKIARQRLARDPDNTKARNWIAWIWAEELRENLPEALDLVEQIRALAVDFDRRPDFLEPLGRIQYRLGHLHEALRLLEQAHALCPLDVDMQARLAEVRKAVRDAESADRRDIAGTASEANDSEDSS
ncbi:MAG TPA: tetratricopeptide repeat protein [Isosphaeraceae bacterium]